MSDTTEQQPRRTHDVHTYKNGWGRTIERRVNLTIHLDDFRDRPGFAWLLLAANAENMSLAELEDYLSWMPDARHFRPSSWLQKRRWIFQPPGKRLKPRRHQDGRDEYALRIANAHRDESARQVVRILREHGIIRTRDWVQRHRDAEV